MFVMTLKVPFTLAELIASRDGLKVSHHKNALYSEWLIGCVVLHI